MEKAQKHPTSVCKSCGAPLLKKDKFCGKCGASVEEERQKEQLERIAKVAEPVYCNSCGQKNDPSAKFCSSCGYDIEANEPVENQGQYDKLDTKLRNPKFIKRGWIVVSSLPAAIILYAIVSFLTQGQGTFAVVANTLIFILGAFSVIGLPIGVILLVVGYNYRPDRTDKAVALPPEAKGWNWGAFFLGPLWGVAFKSWATLWVLVPYVGWFVMPFINGYNGNKWAWQNKQWASVGEFKATQRKWGGWGLVVFVLSIVIGFISQASK